MVLFQFFSLNKESFESLVLPLLPCITLFRPLISLMDDLAALLLLPPLPLVVVPDVPWLWLCKSVWVCVELNKEWMVASWLLSGLETWFLGGPIVGGPCLRWVNGREGKCCESVFCCSTVKEKDKRLDWLQSKIWYKHVDWTHLSKATSRIYPVIQY